jgi:hypothetical protein
MNHVFLFLFSFFVKLLWSNSSYLKISEKLDFSTFNFLNFPFWLYYYYNIIFLISRNSVKSTSGGQNMHVKFHFGMDEQTDGGMNE